MRKFLVVGCGGSGGSTLAFMMDQLKSELYEYGIPEIPAGWQFLHIDVPVAPDTRIAGIGNVFQQGGGYVATGPNSGSYPVLDNAVSQTLKESKTLGEIGTWAPREPKRISVPVHSGAGQMRSVGRMITLSKANQIRAALQQAYQNLNLVETNTRMEQVSKVLPGAGVFKSAEPPVVLVVSSMAGGAGASMALDVCRLLSLVPGVNPGMVGVFMIAADAFDGLPQSARGGVRANALAMLGEIVAAQTAAADDHDTKILAALGEQSGEAGISPFARVFPVGRFAGIERTMFGDGSQKALYRGLGRGLSALMRSDQASHEFVHYDLGNLSDNPPRLEYLGWGADETKIPWGAFGFASLSMGRDRYAEYSAQRLARSAVDRLRSGHMQEGNTASSEEQVNALVVSQWSNICEELELPVLNQGPASHQDVLKWFTESAFKRSQAARLASGIADDQLAPFIPAAGGMHGGQWIGGVRGKLQARKAAVTTATIEAAYVWAYDYKDALLSRFVSQIEQAVTKFGLPFGRAVVARLEASVRDQLIVTLKEMAEYAIADVSSVPSQFEGEIGSMKIIANGPAVVDRLVDMLRGQATDVLYSQAAGSAARVLAAFVTDVLAPMNDALSEAIDVLNNQVSAEASPVGLASVATDHYPAWPSDADARVPDRFGVADNEILVTEPSTFGAQYESDVAASGGAGLGLLGFREARDLLTQQTISGTWPDAGGSRAPGGLLELTSTWRPGEFSRDPLTRVPNSPSRAQFVLHASPAEILGRSRQYVRRTGEPFHQFCSLSLRHYAQGQDARESELPGRRADIVEKFNRALHRAVPLISVHSDVVQEVHGEPVAYRFKFSSIPFKGTGDVVDLLIAKSAENPSIGAETADILARSLTDDETVQRIDIFGSYRNYSPLAFSSVLSPVAEQWAQTSLPERKGFWAHRRSRPLAASLPMGEVERRAMISGWFVGQITGQLRLPEPPYDEAVEIWDAENRRWIQFPNPLLTPPSQFLAKSYDWLPAVLESFLLAIANSHRPPVLSSLRPYQLLRGLYDSTPEEPAAGLLEVAAIQTLSSWLGTGRTVSGSPSRVPNIALGATPEDRLKFATEWLESIRALAGDHFMAPDKAGNAGGGVFSQITSRHEASSTPLFRDLADDVYSVAGDLLKLLDTSYGRAMDAGPGRIDSALPEIGTF